MSEKRKSYSGTVSTRIREASYENLKDVAQKRGLKMLDILDYMTRKMIDLDMLSEGWEERLIEGRMTEYKEKIDAQFKAKVEQERNTWKMRIRHDLLIQYVKALDATKRLEFIGGLLGDLNDPNFIEKIGAVELIFLDGERSLIRLDSEGRPIFVNPERVIPCSKGYHTKDKYCACDLWRDCAIRHTEYTEFRFRTSSEGRQYARLKDHERKRRH